MQRRVFLSSIPATAFVAWQGPALAEGIVEYTPGLVDAALEDGKTVLVRYGAVWCSTCARQERIINQLRATEAAYDKSILFVDVDWDDYGDHWISVSRNIPRRSTLVLLRGAEELGRIVAGTARNQIKALLDKGLNPPS